MTIENKQLQRTPGSVSNSIATSVGRFYEKRHQLRSAFDQYTKAIALNPNDTATYIDRSRVLLKMGSICKAQEDTDSALNLVGDMNKNSTLLFYYACLQKAEVLYADGEFELALMYFHRANKVKPAQQTCIDGIRKTTEILQCTICNPNIRLMMSSNLVNVRDKQPENMNLLNRPPVRKSQPFIDIPLTNYTDRDTNRLLAEIVKDRKLLIDIYKDEQSSTVFLGLNKAKQEAQQSIAIIEVQLKFLNKAECLHLDESPKREKSLCSSKMNRPNFLHTVEEELIYLQKLPRKEKSIEILYRSMKLINCLQLFDNVNNAHNTRIRLLLAEAFRLVGQSYNELKLFAQSLDNYKQVYEILLPLKDQSCLYRAIFDIAHSLMITNQHIEAIETFHEMLSKATSDSERAFVYQHLSLLYLYLNNYDEAKKYAYECLDYATMSNEELLRIEANILLGKIYFELKDFQRSQEYIVYALNLKDQIGDLNQMKDLDELIANIQNQKEKVFQEKLSPFVQFEEEYLAKMNEEWISSTMVQSEHREVKLENEFFEQFYNKNTSNWCILTPYCQLFDICTERKKKHRRNMDSTKQSISAVAASSPNLPLVNTQQ